MSLFHLYFVDMSIDEYGMLKSLKIMRSGTLCALNFSWPISGRMHRLLTLNRDFRKHVFCFAAKYNSLPPEHRYETIKHAQEKTRKQMTNTVEHYC